ncbi:hypothetical protein ACFRQM_50275 [Streptomyces sp. NPDC056831]|uniref:hypothetical protein n=1 Tax=Streptomyces sp. NPDC056831 TaxID=3345954 RepID=UPI00369591B8
MRAVARPDKGCAPGAVNPRRPVRTTAPALRTVTLRVRTGKAVHSGDAHRCGGRE